MKVFRYILTTILILVPTILAVGLYYHAQRVPIAKKSVERIELVDTRGEEHTFRKENAEDSSVTMAMGLFAGCGAGRRTARGCCTDNAVSGDILQL